MKEFSARGKSVWKLYLWLHGLFAFLYGAFASYCYLYLGIQVRLASGTEYLPKSLLPFMAGTLLLEAVASPIAGAYADARGRQAAVKRGLHLLALSYALLASLPLIRDFGGFWVLWIGLAGVGLMSVAAAFHANALDAWFVDELLDSPASASLLKIGHGKPDLHRFFARQSQVFGGCLLAGGVLTLCLGKLLSDSARKESLALLSPGSAVWVIGALSALWIAQRLGNRLRPARRAEPLAIVARTAEVLKSRELVRALLLSSAVYLCGLSVIYFLPQLLREKGGDAAANPAAAWLSTHYWVFYVAIGLTRVLGPALSLTSGPRKPSFDSTPMSKLLGKSFAFRKRQAWYWGALGFGGVAVAGLVFLFAPGRYFLIPLALILFAKLAIEAFKPVQASYLNELVTRKSRAFSLSLATPFGSAALGGIAILLIGLEGASPGDLPIQQARLAIPLGFSALGFLTLLILRAVTRPARSAALGEPWEDKRKRLRDELRREGELPSEHGPERGMTSDDDFIRPLGAGDIPMMRPMERSNADRSADGSHDRPMVIRANRRTRKPEYLRSAKGSSDAAPEAAPAQTTGATPPAAPPSSPTRRREGRPNLRIVYSRPSSRSEGNAE